MFEKYGKHVQTVTQDISKLLKMIHVSMITLFLKQKKNKGKTLPNLRSEFLGGTTSHCPEKLVDSRENSINIINSTQLAKSVLSKFW